VTIGRIPAALAPVFLLGTILVLGSILIAPGGVSAQMGVSERPSATEIEQGKLEFRLYCVQCHGIEGIGNGPVAPALRTKPANLRMLAKNRGGVFPEQEVRDFIDGTKQLAAHGTRDMPIWGLAFQYRGSAVGDIHAPPPASEAEVDRRIDRLVAYIKSIQAQ
jgi:mono/diheme cytochrome c family protein